MRDLQLLLSVPDMTIEDSGILKDLAGLDPFRRYGCLQLIQNGSNGLPLAFEQWIAKPNEHQVAPRPGDGTLVWVALLLNNDREGYNSPVLRRLMRALDVEWRGFSRDSLRLVIVTCGIRPLHEAHLIRNDKRVSVAHVQGRALGDALHALRVLISAS